MIQNIMKRHILIALLLMMVLPSFAQEKRGKRPPSPYKHEFNVTWGIVSGDLAYSYHSYFSNYEGGLDYIYGNYMKDVRTSGVISADYNIQFKRWFALGTQANASFNRHTEMSSITGKPAAEYGSFAVSVLAYARFTYLNRKYVKLYSAFGLGFRYSRMGEPAELHYSTPDTGFRTAFQFVPYGVTVGNKVYGMMECCIGSETSGMRVGIGYRF